MDEKPVGLDDALTDEDKDKAEEEEAARREAERLDLTPLWHWVDEWDEGRWLTEYPPKRRNLLEWVPKTATGGLAGKPETFLPLGKTAMLASAGGVGKTQVLTQLAVAVATRTSWLSPEIEVASPGHVLLALGEEDPEEVRRRLWYSTRGMNEDQHELVRKHILALPLCGRSVALQGMASDKTLHPTDFARRLREHLVNSGVEWRLLILDPASRFMGPEAETDNQAATRFVEALEGFLEVPGNPTVLVAHHTTKGALRESRATGTTDQTAARGSSALTDGVRWQAGLFTTTILDEPVVTLEITKSNYGPRHGVKLVRDEEHNRFRVQTASEAEALEARKRQAEAEERAREREAKKEADRKVKDQGSGGMRTGDLV